MKPHITRMAASAAVLGFWLLAQGTAVAQASAPPPPAAAMGTLKIPEGTEIRLKLLEKLSSATASDGDTFQVVSAEPIRLADGTLLPAGYSGVGEVTHAEHNGWLGKSGQLNVKADYLKVGSARIHLRGAKGGEGKGNTGNLVAAVVVFGVFGAAVHGHSIVYPEGTTLTAFVDTDTEIPLPLAQPPQAN